ncbi:Hypothetical predicted protein [Octopus vulgaris]|uniref:Uncharacterized protein n=1 Tax=Octopus vulgaris TaxID=6645 RepID=A0AA36B2W7_OCTVU|nr:Hypothetical predicted protein [Octopus vulgaris]
MTINKAEEKTFEKAGIQPVFSHSQLYVAFSGARAMNNIKQQYLYYNNLILTRYEFSIRLVTESIVLGILRNVSIRIMIIQLSEIDLKRSNIHQGITT